MTWLSLDLWQKIVFLQGDENHYFRFDWIQQHFPVIADLQNRIHFILEQIVVAWQQVFGPAPIGDRPDRCRIRYQVLF